MAVTVHDVRKVAQLARLKFDGAEERRLVDDLNQILTYVAALDELPTDDVEPTAHVLPLNRQDPAAERVQGYSDQDRPVSELRRGHATTDRAR